MVEMGQKTSHFRIIAQFFPGQFPFIGRIVGLTDKWQFVPGCCRADHPMVLQLLPGWSPESEVGPARRIARGGIPAR